MRYPLLEALVVVGRRLALQNTPLCTDATHERLELVASLLSKNRTYVVSAFRLATTTSTDNNKSPVD